MRSYRADSEVVQTDLTKGRTECSMNKDIFKEGDLALCKSLPVRELVCELVYVFMCVCVA